MLLCKSNISQRANCEQQLLGILRENDDNTDGGKTLMLSFVIAFGEKKMAKRSTGQT